MLISKWFRVKKCGDKVRTSLNVEDIVFERSLKELKEYGLVEEVDGVLIFRDAFSVPNFQRYYGSKVSGVKDRYLVEVLQDLLYLNPDPDALGVKRLTEFVVRTFVKTKREPSKVKSGVLVSRPVLSYEEVLPCVITAVGLSRLEDYVPSGTEFILYPEKSGLDRHQKRSIKAQVHKERARGLYGEAIHHTVEYLIADQPMVKITYPRIHNTKLVVREGTQTPISVRLIRDYIYGNTKERFKVHNRSAPFKSEVAARKYEEFLMLPAHVSLDKVVGDLKVSKSTAVAFKKIRNGSE